MIPNKKLLLHVNLIVYYTYEFFILYLLRNRLKSSSLTLCGVLGTFRGILGGVEASLVKPLSCPKMEVEYGELGPEEWSVLNLNIFLLGLIGEP